MSAAVGHYLKVRAHNQSRGTDPLKYWRFGVERLKEAFALFARGTIKELHCRACNKGTKPLADDEPVLTERGWMRIADVRVGDSVAVRDGSFAPVSVVAPQGVQPIYRVGFSDGSYSRCTADHLWIAKNRRARFGDGPEVVLRTDQLEYGAAVNRHAVPGCKVIRWPNAQLPLPAYLVGAFIGDGHLGKNVRITTVDPDILFRVAHELPEGCRLKQYSERPDWSVVGAPQILRELLVGLGLYRKRSWEKHIPGSYLRAGIEQRKDLLRGLMDTDGTADARGRCSYTTVSPRLAEDVADLVVMLGGTARIVKSKSHYRRGSARIPARDAYQVRMRLPFNPFTLPRKMARWRAPRRSLERVVRSVTSDGHGPCTCIGVDHPSHSFITRSGLVTHNTETSAAFVLACCRKLKVLDGVRLPQWRGPVEAAQFVLDYKLELLSVQAAYLRLIGNHPHHARYQGEYLSTLHIMPEGGDPDSESGWSVIHFISQKNPQAGVGARADIAAFDEPPLMPVLREMRKASHAGRLGIRIIVETPTSMSRWVELREDYGECPRRSIRIVDQDRAEVRWSLDEVASWILSDAEKDELRRSYAREPYLRDAREHGDYSVTEGQHPFDVDTLLLMLKECRDPEIIQWKVQREKHEEEMAKVIMVDVEVFEEPRTDATYYFPCDPASGVQDKSHNPLGMLGARRGPGDLVIRYNGRIAPYSLGRLGAGLGRQYNTAPVDIEMNDHWGVNVYRGLQDSHYPNIAHEKKRINAGEFSKEIGFKADAKGKKLAVGEIQNWTQAWAAEIRYAKCPSRRVIESIMDCVLDEDGKVVPGRDLYGGHGEDVVLWGRILSRAVSQASRQAQRLYDPPKSRQDKLLDEIIAPSKPSNGVPYGGLPKPRARPK